jgi:hypothetical protein
MKPQEISKQPQILKGMKYVDCSTADHLRTDWRNIQSKFFHSFQKNSRGSTESETLETATKNSKFNFFSCLSTFFSAESQKQSPFSLSSGIEKSYRSFDFLVAVYLQPIPSPKHVDPFDEVFSITSNKHESICTCDTDQILAAARGLELDFWKTLRVS